MISYLSVKTEIEAQLSSDTYDVLTMAASFEALLENAVQGETVIGLIPGEDIGEEQDSTGLTMSNVESSIQIVLGVMNHEDSVGEQVQDSLHDMRTAIAGILQGFTPTGSDDNLHFSSGRPLLYEDNRVWHSDVYSASYRLRG